MNGHSDSDEQPGRGWLDALVNPFFLFQGLAEAFNSWLFTRPWRKLCWSLPLLVVVAVPVGLVVRGARLKRDALLMRYSLLVEEELRQAAEAHDEQSNSSVTAPLMREEATTPFADLLYRRLLRMDDRDPRTRYMIALRLARSGRLSQARHLMQELSPAGAHGYPPAHAWLAVDLLSRPPLSRDGRTDLMHHLGETLHWEGVGSGLLAVYAQMLAADGKRTEALDIMGNAARKNSNLQSAFAVMARRLNMPKLAEASSAAAKKSLSEKVQSPEAVEQDFYQLCLLQLTDNEPEAALETARKGLESQSAESQQLKYLASEALRVLYRKSIQQTDTGIDLNLALLDEAMRMCPSNPHISTEIAQLAEMGIAAPPAFKAAMQQQLLNGQATALAHLVLANQEIKAGRIGEAIPHLELSLRQAPNHPVTLNNLALALAMTRSDQIERAEQLIAKAISINSRNPEYYDTQGEIRLLANRPLDAIESLEKAIGIAHDRQHTRELMIKAYRAAGMEDLAAQQEKMLADAEHATSPSEGQDAEEQSDRG